MSCREPGVACFAWTCAVVLSIDLYWSTLRSSSPFQGNPSSIYHQTHSDTEPAPRLKPWSSGVISTVFKPFASTLGDAMQNFALVASSSASFSCVALNPSSKEPRRPRPFGFAISLVLPALAPLLSLCSLSPPSLLWLVNVRKLLPLPYLPEPLPGFEMKDPPDVLKRASSKDAETSSSSDEAIDGRPSFPNAGIGILHVHDV